MYDIETYFLVFIIIQFFHSIEELSTGFHKKCPFFKMKFGSFLAFEILFIMFWTAVYLLEQFPFREKLMGYFILLMLANGIWHITWWGISKKYVPGIITAPLFVIAFIGYYSHLI
ncbi:MAG: HXXEE domain-containing protein [Bacteroidia bacterium]|nr:HXXEE domain-containing protein [Bacteroidia bacterium]NNF31074.1 HXXEE domain-containing protein [Flavobacteriaceae bacterium]MBT8276962.1 HXXEE domain-containing protein [Bacteroidia bacterium]NNJ81765.1 HXXEE domain-containing protein [Flavobacteriaceae bacterium]NNK55307.1 HXXEE domain-containing protein [Flavobacteriaceae bacterium]